MLQIKIRLAASLVDWLTLQAHRQGTSRNGAIARLLEKARNSTGEQETAEAEWDANISAAEKLIAAYQLPSGSKTAFWMGRPENGLEVRVTRPGEDEQTVAIVLHGQVVR
jgi:hypothetical protein